MDNIEISVIIPFFNGEKTLRKCIESVLNQELTCFELILVDDGSTDNSKNICNIYAENDKRIRVIYKENGGVGSARNIGLNLARGKYIMFCDSDDYIESNMLDILYKNIKQNNADISICGCFWDMYNGEELTKTIICGYSNNIDDYISNMGKYFKYMFSTSSILLQSPWCKLYKSKIIKQNNIYFKENMICSEDFEFNLRFLSKCKKFSYTKEILYHYNAKENLNTLKKRKKDNLVDETSLTYEAWCQFIENVNNNSDLKEFMNYQFIDLYMIPLKKIIVEWDEMDYLTKKEIVKYLVKDNSFNHFKEIINLRFFNILSKMVNIKCYRLALNLIKIKVKV